MDTHLAHGGGGGEGKKKKKQMAAAAAAAAAVCVALKSGQPRFVTFFFFCGRAPEEEFYMHISTDTNQRIFCYRYLMLLLL